jgi:selenocysteine lyase/cysteine desulfurase
MAGKPSNASTTSGVRELFAIPREVAYLNCATMSPQLRGVTEAGLASVRSKESPWTLATPDDWFGPAETLRGLAAELLGATSDAVALVPAVSYGVAVAAANLPVAAGQSLVVVERDFPSSVYGWHSVAARRGAHLRTARCASDETWTDAVMREIDERTAVVAVPQCHWTDGSTFDLARIGARARAVGAALVVDASQSLGVVPIDIGAIQPDFLFAVGYKWLLGPYGLSYLYAPPRWREVGVPIEDAWQTRKGSEDFARLVEYNEALRPGARRFDMGQSMQFALAPMASQGLRQILAWGVPAIGATIAKLTARIARLAEEQGYRAVPAGWRSPHLIGIRREGGIDAELPRRLSAERVYVSVRGDSIRIAPYLYNDELDVDRLFALLRPGA